LYGGGEEQVPHFGTVENSYSKFLLRHREFSIPVLTKAETKAGFGLIFNEIKNKLRRKTLPKSRPKLKN
jgi:hypothetical protein